MSQNGAHTSKGTKMVVMGGKREKGRVGIARVKMRKEWPRGTLHETEAKTLWDHLRCESAKVTRLRQQCGRQG